MAQTNILLETGTNELEIVEFYVNQDGYEAHYGLNVAKVVEIGRRQSVTAMPEMRHKALLGAFLHRNGRVVPLIDMAQFLDSGPIENEDAKVIVTEFNGVCTGFLVSTISVVVSGALEGLGKGIESLVISLCRYIVVIMPLAWLFCHFAGADGIWHAFWLTEFLTAAISLVVYHKSVKLNRI